MTLYWISTPNCPPWSVIMIECWRIDCPTLTVNVRLPILATGPLGGRGSVHSPRPRHQIFIPPLRHRLSRRWCLLHSIRPVRRITTSATPRSTPTDRQHSIRRIPLIRNIPLPTWLNLIPRSINLLDLSVLKKPMQLIHHSLINNQPTHHSISRPGLSISRNHSRAHHNRSNRPSHHRPKRIPT